MDVLMTCKLFQEMTMEEINSILNCFSAKEKEFKKGEFICNQGDVMAELCVVLEGSVHIIKSDYWGNQTIMTEVRPGEIFGESYACAEMESQVAAMALEKTRILKLNLLHMMTVCTSACPCHNRMIKNLIMVMARKNVNLTEKIEHMSKRTTRNKLLSYLSAQAKKTGKSSFTIPFNRQQLADYLSVERSAMSAELSKLKDEGILDYDKNYFILTGISAK